MPAFGQLRRSVYRTAPPEARGWLGALGVVARHPEGIRPSAVAELLNVDLSVASRQLAQLEALRYVVRETDPADRRASLVRATDHGAAWIDAFGERFAATVRDSLDGWSDDDVHTLTNLLHRFDDSLRKAQQ